MVRITLLRAKSTHENGGQTGVRFRARVSHPFLQRRKYTIASATYVEIQNQGVHQASPLKR
jgi:hypothetical protein